MRTMTLALLLASATSGSAFAQTRGEDRREAGEPGPRREWTERRNVQQAAPQVDQSRGNREQRQAEALPERAPRGRWGGEVTTPPVPPVPQAQPSGGWAGNRGWRGGRGDVMTTNPSVPTPPTDRRWQGRGDDDNRNDGRRWDRGRGSASGNLRKWVRCPGETRRCRKRETRFLDSVRGWCRWFVRQGGCLPTG